MSSRGLVNFLRLVWVVAIIWYELAAFPYQVSQCSWPEVATDSPEILAKPTHVLLIADPQVLDHRSYPDRPAWLMWLSQRIVDLNMRKSWWATKQLRPDAIIFLGDMMDNGRFAMSEAEYESYVGRTKDIFSTDESIPVYYIPGNHDVGIGISDEWSERSRDRWLSHFGLLQQRLEIAGHTFVLLDAPSLVEEERQREISGLSFARWAAANPSGSIAFAQESIEVSRSSGHPTILLTHIPLFRSRSTSCGPLREHGTIRDGSGYGYENTLNHMTSNMLLEGIRPSVVFSGDDHDYCEVHHVVRPTDDIPLSTELSVKEISVKSFSIAMGIKQPGFQLLSLVPSSSVASSEPTLSDVPCLLPFQLGIYVLVYAPLAALSLFILLLYHFFRAFLENIMHSSMSTSLPLRNMSPPADIEQVRSSALRSPELSPSNSQAQILRAYDSPGVTGEADFMLPPPSPGIGAATKHKAKRRNAYPSHLVFRFNVGGRKLVADLTSLWDFILCGWCCGTVRGGGGRRTRVLRAFLDDVLAVACIPLALFVALAWWFL